MNAPMVWPCHKWSLIAFIALPHLWEDCIFFNNRHFNLLKQNISLKPWQLFIEKAFINNFYFSGKASFFIIFSLTWVVLTSQQQLSNFLLSSYLHSCVNLDSIRNTVQFLMQEKFRRKPHYAIILISKLLYLVLMLQKEI